MGFHWQVRCHVASQAANVNSNRNGPVRCITHALEPNTFSRTFRDSTSTTLRSRCSRMCVHGDYVHDQTSCRLSNAGRPSLDDPAMLWTFRVIEQHHVQRRLLHTDTGGTGCALPLPSAPEEGKYRWCVLQAVHVMLLGR
jgi:hypothetical protein